MVDNCPFCDGKDIHHVKTEHCCIDAYDLTAALNV